MKQERKGQSNWVGRRIRLTTPRSVLATGLIAIWYEIVRRFPHQESKSFFSSLGLGMLLTTDMAAQEQL